MAISASNPPLLPGPSGRPTPAERAPALAEPAALPESRRESLRERVLRVGRTLLVGAAASALDLAVIAVSVRWLGWDPTLSRAVALGSSGIVLFFGNRSFAFRAQAGNITRQARLFVITEFFGLLLNLLIFRGLVAGASVVAPELASQIANFLVFVGFCYPMRAFVVFRSAVR